jgi:hypothetical protein
VAAGSLILTRSLIFASQFSYTRGDNVVQLEPLKGQIDVEKSDYSVGKIKIEVRFAKVAAIRWGGLVGDAPDREYCPCHVLGP